MTGTARRRLFRVARWVLVALLALYALYLVAINVILSTSLFERLIDAEPDVVDIHFARGWSVLPGRIHARDLRIRGADSHVEWILTIGEVTFDLDLLGLTHKHFTASRVRGSNVSMRIRQRLPAPTADRADYADLPPVPGFGPYGVAPPPRFDAGDWDDRYYHLWTIRLTDVQARDVREIWIDRERFLGRAEIDGGFYLRPLRDVRVGPIDLRIASGDLGAAVHAIAGSARLTIDSFDPRTTLLRGVLRHVSATTELRASFATPAAAGDLPRLALVIDHGHLAAGSHADLAAVLRAPALHAVVGLVVDVGERVGVRGVVEELRAGPIAVARARFVAQTAETDLTVEDVPRFSIRGSGHAGLHEGALRAEADVELAADLDPGKRWIVVHDVDLTLGDVGGKLAGAGFAARRVRLGGRSPRLDPAAPSLRGADVRLEIESGTADLAGLGKLGPELQIDSGRARLDGKLDLRSADPARKAGSLQLSVAGLHLRWKEGRYACDLTAQALVEGYRAATAELDLSGSRLTFVNVVVGDAPIGTDSWQGSVDLGAGRVGLESPPSFAAQLALRAKDATPFVAAAFAGKVPGVLAGMVRMRGLTASADVRVGRGTTEIENVKAKGSDVTVEGSYKSVGDDVHGIFNVKKGLVVVGVTIDGDGVHAKPFSRAEGPKRAE